MGYVCAQRHLLPIQLVVRCVERLQCCSMLQLFPARADVIPANVEHLHKNAGNLASPCFHISLVAICGTCNSTNSLSCGISCNWLLLRSSRVSRCIAKLTPGPLRSMLRQAMSVLRAVKRLSSASDRSSLSVRSICCSAVSLSWDRSANERRRNLSCEKSRRTGYLSCCSGVEK